jgi:hypothetical protein
MTWPTWKSLVVFVSVLILIIGILESWNEAYKALRD